jgi:hypothetical protein
MTTLTLRVLESQPLLDSLLPTLGLQRQETSTGISLSGTREDVVSALLESFHALEGEALRVELLVDRRDRYTSKSTAELVLSLKQLFARATVSLRPRTVNQ